jgi:hypothetical protein
MAARTVGNLETHTPLSSLRAREPIQPTVQHTTDIVRIVRVKEFGDTNLSTQLSVVMMIGCGLLVLL